MQSCLLLFCVCLFGLFRFFFLYFGRQQCPILRATAAEVAAVYAYDVASGVDIIGHAQRKNTRTQACQGSNLAAGW
jgi:hypothetical protein